ncbi:MAG TPA: metallophosphoesterase [Sporichthyaceae bacterium]|nr:metallophosphoesterase [Sporichthyaceae bacterium]
MGVPPRLAEQMTVGEQHDWIRTFLSQRPVSRRSALKAAAGALTVLGVGPVLAESGVPFTGSAAPPFLGRRLSFGSDPRRQMAMAAELTHRPTGSVLVDLGTDRGYGRTMTAEVRHLISAVPQQDGSIRAAEQYFVHALAADLEPGRAYHYRFRLPGGAATRDAVFSTAPAERAAFRFTAFGDQGVDPGNGVSAAFGNRYNNTDTRRSPHPAASLIRQVTAIRPAFHLLAGDICYPGADGEPVRNNHLFKPDSGFDNFDPLVWTRYFAGIEPSAASTPWMFATGNHDVEALYDDNRVDGATHGYGGHAARLDLPTNGPRGCPSVYSFRYGNVGVLSLDSNDLTFETRASADYSSGAQVNWVRSTLHALRQNPQIDFIVVFFHHCAYSTGLGHGSDDGVRSRLAPLFDEFSVDLAVQAHNHCWERTDPIRAGRTTVAAPNGGTVRPDSDGTTYICAGSGGRSRTSWPDGVTDRYPGRVGADSAGPVTATVRMNGGVNVPETVPWSRARYLGYAMLAVEVVPGALLTDSKMVIRTISDRGELLDTITLLRPASIFSALGPLL